MRFLPLLLLRVLNDSTRTPHHVTTGLQYKHGASDTTRPHLRTESRRLVRQNTTVMGCGSEYSPWEAVHQVSHAPHHFGESGRLQPSLAVQRGLRRAHVPRSTSGGRRSSTCSINSGCSAVLRLDLSGCNAGTLPSGQRERGRIIALGFPLGFPLWFPVGWCCCCWSWCCNNTTLAYCPLGPSFDELGPSLPTSTTTTITTTITTITTTTTTIGNRAHLRSTILRFIIAFPQRILWGTSATSLARGPLRAGVHQGEPILIFLVVSPVAIPRLHDSRSHDITAAAAVHAREPTLPEPAVPPVPAWRPWSKRGRPSVELVPGEWRAGVAAWGHHHHRRAMMGLPESPRVYPAAAAVLGVRRVHRGSHEPLIPHGLGVGGAALLATLVRSRMRHEHARVVVHGWVKMLLLIVVGGEGVVVAVVQLVAFAHERPISRVLPV